MRRLHKHLTYSNVMSTLAVFLVLAGGVAYATHEDIHSSDIVNETIQRVDIAPSTGKLYFGQKRVTGNDAFLDHSIVHIPKIANVVMNCWDDSPRGDQLDSMTIQLRNTSTETLRVSGISNEGFVLLPPGGLTDAPLLKYWDNHIFQIGSGGTKAQLATVIASGEALEGNNDCFIQAHAISHLG